jgi:hypothetical protein
MVNAFPEGFLFTQLKQKNHSFAVAALPIRDSFFLFSKPNCKLVYRYPDFVVPLWAHEK